MDSYKIISILKSKFPEIKRTSSRWVNFNCPFCQDRGYKQDRKHHFGINYEKGYTNCFKCGTRHKLTYFLKLIDADFNNEDFVFESQSLPTGAKPLLEFPKGFINILDLLDARYPDYVNALNYIDKRVGVDLALKLNIGFCYTGKYANRIIVPVFDTEENIVYFVARAIYDFLYPKVLNPLGERKSILFNWHTAQKFPEIFLSEGVFGALTVYPYGVATLGKEITDEQILAILRSDVNIVNILLDGNALKEAYKTADRILSYTSKVKVRVLKLKVEAQPDDHDFEFLLRLKSSTEFYRGNVFI